MDHVLSNGAQRSRLEAVCFEAAEAFTEHDAVACAILLRVEVTSTQPSDETQYSQPLECSSLSKQWIAGAGMQLMYSGGRCIQSPHECLSESVRAHWQIQLSLPGSLKGNGRSRARHQLPARHASASQPRLHAHCYSLDARIGMRCPATPLSPRGDGTRIESQRQREHSAYAAAWPGLAELKQQTSLNGSGGSKLAGTGATREVHTASSATETTRLKAAAGRRLQFEAASAPA